MIEAEHAFLLMSALQDRWWLRTDDLVRAQYGVGVRHLEAIGYRQLGLHQPMSAEIERGCRNALQSPRVASLMGIITGIHLARQMLSTGTADDVDPASMGIEVH